MPDAIDVLNFMTATARAYGDLLIAVEYGGEPEERYHLSVDDGYKFLASGPTLFDALVNAMKKDKNADEACSIESGAGCLPCNGDDVACC